MRRLDQPHRAAVGGTAGCAATTARRSFCDRRAREHEAAGGESHVLLGFLWTAPRPPPHRPQSHRPPPRSPSCPSPRARPTTRRLSFAPPATRHRHCAAPSAARRATAFRRPRPPRAPPRATGRRGPLKQPTRVAADRKRRCWRHAARGRRGAFAVAHRAGAWKRRRAGTWRRCRAGRSARPVATAVAARVSALIALRGGGGDDAPHAAVPVAAAVSPF